jgi:hypothetical protein
LGGASATTHEKRCCNHERTYDSCYPQAIWRSEGGLVRAGIQTSEHA